VVEVLRVEVAMNNLRRWLQAARHEAGLSLILFLQVSIMFVVAPLSSTGWLSAQVVEAFRFGLGAAAVLTVVRGRLPVLLILGSFGVSIFLQHELREGVGATGLALTSIAVTSLFDVVVAVAVARVAFGPGRVTVHRILGGVILYLSIGLVFANLYRAAAIGLNPSFSGLPPDRRRALSEMLYFSLGALTTGGTGAIEPLHPFVRSLANLESVIGQLFPPVLLGRLVSLHAAAAVDEDEPNGGSGSKERAGTKAPRFGGSGG
jgi:hypothetical protein